MMSNISEYLEPNPKLHQMLLQFKEQGKQMFVLTNRYFSFHNIVLHVKLSQNPLLI